MPTLKSPAGLLTSPIGFSARSIAAEQVRVWSKARRSLGRTFAPAAVHDFRVALRRLRTTLKTYRADVSWQLSLPATRGLRRLSVRSGACRDLQVQRAWLEAVISGITRAPPAGIADLLGALADEEAAVRAQFARTVESRFDLVLRGLRSAVLVPRRRSRLAARERLESWIVVRRRIGESVARVEAMLGAVTSIDETAAAHRARIAVKELRYLIDPFAPALEGGAEALGRLEPLQRVLGELRDRSAISVRLAGIPGAAGQGLVARRVKVESRLLFDRLRAEWLGGGAGAVLAPLRGLTPRPAP